MLKTDVKQQKQQFALRFRGSGARVLLQGVPAGHHHVFLSHSQKHGQDQVASLKQTLARAIEGIQIFLDVDTLDNVQDLPMLVRRSNNIVLFTTEEVWSREFIITEMGCAVSTGVDVIVLREIDPRCVCACLSFLYGVVSSVGVYLLAQSRRYQPRKAQSGLP
jgi:hypothetical protein